MAVLGIEAMMNAINEGTRSPIETGNGLLFQDPRVTARQRYGTAGDMGRLLDSLDATRLLNSVTGGDPDGLNFLDPGRAKGPDDLDALDRLLQVAELAGLATLAFGGIGREESIGQPFRSGGTPAPTATAGMGLIAPMMQLNQMAANPRLHQVRL